MRAATITFPRRIRITSVSGGPAESVGRLGAVDYYRRPGVANFGRLAVLPESQGRGYASRLLDFAEARARELGYEELALDTSENADRLIAIYSARGYRLVDHHQWPEKNYRSVILAKRLQESKSP